MSIKKIYHVSTMVRYCAVEGADVVHVLYNLHSMESLEKRLACVLILKLGQHHLCLPVTLIRQTGCVYTVLVFRGGNHGTIFQYIEGQVPIMVPITGKS